MNKPNPFVANYKSHDAAESAIKLLQRSGRDMKGCRCVGRDYRSDEQP